MVGKYMSKFNTNFIVLMSHFMRECLLALSVTKI